MGVGTGIYTFMTVGWTKLTYNGKKDDVPHENL